jgi:hypothetical protein
MDSFQKPTKHWQQSKQKKPNRQTGKAWFSGIVPFKMQPKQNCPDAHIFCMSKPSITTSQVLHIISNMQNKQ